MFYIVVIHTDSGQMNFALIALCQPGGAPINFSKSAQNQNRTTLSLWPLAQAKFVLDFEIVNSFTFKITQVQDNHEFNIGCESEQFWK